MKKILFSFFLASSFFFPFSARAENQLTATEPANLLEAVFSIEKLLSLWADLYPQCYQSVADIKEILSEISSNNDYLQSSVNNIFSSLTSIDNYCSQIYNNSQSTVSYLSDFYDSFSSFYSYLNGELPLLRQSVSDIFSRLPDFTSWKPDVNVTNFSDLKQILKELFGEIIVNCHLDADPSFNVNVNFDFNYDYFSPLIRFSEKSNKGYFSLNTFTRYPLRTWLFNENDSMDSLVTPVDSSTAGVDILDFLCSCGNALVAQNQDISMLLCQILGFFKSGHEDMNELKQLATSAADGASQDLDSLKSAFHASSLDDVAAQYFVDLNIDDQFDSAFLGFAHGSGSSCPDFIDIGPIPFSKIHDSMTDYTLHFSTAGLKSFFDICRQCFTVVWYLFFLTICIFLARFGWAFLKPILRTLTNVLNW